MEPTFGDECFGHAEVPGMILQDVQRCTDCGLKSQDMKSRKDLFCDVLSVDCGAAFRCNPLEAAWHRRSHTQGWTLARRREMDLH
jgi:hypothetical protein